MILSQREIFNELYSKEIQNIYKNIRQIETFDLGVSTKQPGHFQGIKNDKIAILDGRSHQTLFETNLGNKKGGNKSEEHKEYKKIHLSRNMKH